MFASFDPRMSVFACQLVVALACIFSVSSFQAPSFKNGKVARAMFKSTRTPMTPMSMVTTNRPVHKVPDIVEDAAKDGKMRPRPTDLGWAAVHDQLGHAFGMAEEGECRRCSTWICMYFFTARIESYLFTNI